MKVNDREIQKLGETSTPTLEGVLHHLKPTANDWSDWVTQQSFKQRRFKLVANILFYYRINEEEPLGILILENAEISYEKQHSISFAFSITFREYSEKMFNPDRKHIFSCRTETDLSKWVAALKESSYEHLRSQLTILRTKIMMRTGNDPLENCFNNALHRRQELPLQLPLKKKPIGQKKSTFHSHIQINQPEVNNYSDSTFIQRREESIPVGNLIDL